MRARNVKPSLFKHELLATSDPLHAWIFQGLWCMADREGRLEDRPRRIHLEVNPGRAFEGTESALKWLADQGLILRYEQGGNRYIQVVNFKKHQFPHVREPASTIPAPGQHEAGPSESPFPLPESPILNPVGGEKRAARAPTAKRLPEDFELTEGRRKVSEAEGVTDPAREFSRFHDHWRSASGANARKHDWDAAWRNWCRKAVDMRPRATVAPERTWRPTEEDSGPC